MSESVSNRDEWQVESLRITAFLVDMIDPAETRFWESLVGQVPDEIRSMPHQQLATEEGPCLKGRLRVAVRQKRIDWILSPDLEASTSKPPTIEPYHVLAPLFHDLMQRWLANVPPIHRLGYGGVLLLPLGNLSDVCTKLNSLITTVQLDPEGALDFMYRINRRRESNSGIEGLKLNRLSTWSAVQPVDAHVEIPSSGQGTPVVTQSLGPEIMCRLELDINTSPEFLRAFDTDKIVGVFDELAALGNEIIEQGDIP